MAEALDMSEKMKVHYKTTIRMNDMPMHPLAEVFGFPVDTFSPDAERYRRNKLCPFNNAVDSSFFSSLPLMEEVEQREAEMAWLVYDLQYDTQQVRYRLARTKTIYTRFDSALEKITRAEPGDVQTFIGHLQERLDVKLESGSPPDAPTVLDILDGEEP